MGFFDQFLTPYHLGIPLIAIALTFPWILFFTPSDRWLSNRTIMLQGQYVGQFTRQIFTSINQGGHKWALMLTSLMVFLLFINMLGLLPYTFTPTTQLSLNMGLAVPFWLATVIIGLRNQPTAALAHLLPESTPPLLVPVLIVIETISLFIRPLALGVRLTANLTARHLLIQLIATAVSVLASTTTIVALLTMSVLLLLMMLEVAVAAIQAYVFVLLVSLYLQENT
uniref:ATP synthase subunit a n=1 Tax=Hyphessobrycon amapaensis TaxID=2979626 RepID=A0A977KCL6_9TELE|nr:ATP synthase F0 subunit 6 [Hyphessobrycon amapaensis]UXD78945.1 ATP synthase F0 subunit 6 [Hyphessobrycon amapaensis]